MATPSIASSRSSRRTTSTKPTTVSSRRSSAYDANFRQHCVDNRIYPPFYKFPNGQRPAKPANLDEIRKALKVQRRSLSPSIATETVFENFQDRNTTKSEGTVMRNIIPVIAGNDDIPNEGNLLFTNLTSLTKNMTVNPNPDFFDGAHAGLVDSTVRDALDNIIVPTKKSGVPLAPNLFLEAKGPSGSLEVAEGQIMLNGAHGTKIMFALQNYLVEEPIYDGNAYTFTAIYIDGYLKLYAHHATAPQQPEEQPDYYTTQINAYALTGNHEAWLNGQEAFRNLRKLAQQYRNEFIDRANERARKVTRKADVVNDAPTLKDPHQTSSHDNFFDCLPFAEREDDDDGDDNDDETQQTQGTNVGLAILEQPYDGEDGDDTDVPTHFTTSFTSSFTSLSHDSSQHPKLPRTPPSPSTPRPFKRGSTLPDKNRL
jgi:hypothetical protein